MSRFILIQPGLKSLTGHYHEFAVLMLNCAQAAGYEPVLAVHRQCRSMASFPPGWRVLPVFARAEGRMLPPRRSFAVLRNAPLVPALLVRLFEAVSGALRAFRWQRLADRFRRDYRQLFARVPLEAGDHVLVASASELDFAGLAAYLRTDAQARAVHWSVVFHNALLSGREPEYSAQQTRLAVVRRQLRKSLTGLERHSLHFYATTEALTAQFNLLGVARFDTLPYPVNPELAGADGSLPYGSPLRVICAGGARREKGGEQLPECVTSLRRAALLPGRLQLLVQPDPSTPTEALLRASVPDILARFDDYAAARQSHAPVVLVPSPMSPTDYRDFIRSAHIGLFLYDSRTYYARCSGVLLEMLAAGIPVIVPAGCWLAEQLAEPQQRYLAGLASRSRLDTAPPLAPPHEQLLVRGRSAAVVIEAPVAVAAAELWLHLRAAGKARPWLRVDCEPHCGDSPIQSAVFAVGPQESPLRVMFPASGAARLRLYNAYGDEPIRLEEVTLHCVSDSLAGGKARPTGAVGLIAAENGQLPGLLAQMHAHYAHYRATAREFSRAVLQRHHPQRTLQALLQRAAASPGDPARR